MLIENKEENSIFSGLSLSVAAHAAILSIFLIKTVFFKPLEVDYTAAIRVDLVGLPDKIENIENVENTKENSKTAEKAQALEKVPPPIQLDKPAPPEEAVKIKPSKTQKEALDKIKTQSALDKIRKELAKDHIKKLSQTPSGARPVKGDVVSEGSALKGLEKLELNEYAVILDRHIKQNWQLPEWLSGKGYQAQVRVFVSKSGALIGKNLVSSSGNSEYDQAALNTIQASAPFPSPPGLVAGAMENRGFVVFFP
ncbi:MAG TPA: TonB family protein [Pseudobdellovibrionaceae bacterium]|nr:TonB family protein [Pseudobdellovibrionaceae bacterium]